MTALRLQAMRRGLIVLRRSFVRLERPQRFERQVAAIDAALAAIDRLATVGREQRVH